MDSVSSKNSLGAQRRPARLVILSFVHGPTRAAGRHLRRRRAGPRMIVAFNRWDRLHEFERFRHLQDRHRAFELAHHGTDERGAQLRASCWPRAACSSGHRQVSAQLYGSLALTGRGHCTDRAILLGPRGHSAPTASTPRRSKPRCSAFAPTDAFACWASTRSPSMSRSISCFTSIRCCRGIPTACASPRTTRRSKYWRARNTTASAAASSCRPEPRRRPAKSASKPPFEFAFRRATARSLPSRGPGNPSS